MEHHILCRIQRRWERPWSVFAKMGSCRFRTASCRPSKCTPHAPDLCLAVKLSEDRWPMELLHGRVEFISSARCRQQLLFPMGPVRTSRPDPLHKTIASLLSLLPCIFPTKREYMTTLIQQVYTTHSVLRRQCFQLFRTRSNSTIDA